MENADQQPVQPKQDDSSIDNQQISRSSLLEHATQFLEDESVRDASIESKTKFLEEKGLTVQEIEQVLQKIQETPVPQLTHHEASDLKTVHDSIVSSRDATTTSAQQITSTSTSSQFAPLTKDTPPIITYPEFLLRSQKPPPLITAQRLLYAVYGASAITATVYGASKYLVEPMLSSLAESRHDLLSNTIAHLNKLNEKLEVNVSTLPPILRKSTNVSANNGEDDASSIASDPTELFHRDIATQTSPSLVRSPSSSSSSSSSSPTTSLSPSERSSRLLTSHTSRLNTIRSNLIYLLSIEQECATSIPNPQSTLTSSTLTPQTQNTTSTTLLELQSYLDSLTYGGSTPYLHNTSIPGIDFSNTTTSSRFPHNPPSSSSASTISNNIANPAATAAEEDEMTKLKKEIRGLKGVLLSSRNFPGVGGR
ncbi:putative peroxin 14 17 [Phaeomoniella chlamydospora]|uniref:Peroxisomal membrane protein PEX14 n=1 Tax=Phaeomoniella chlamydospora TaxID=158046 RepID=A0A0G2GEX2_PHACM|nr:putative peroxin 14 17 [Phaeomoniella chlamydospora]